MGTLLFYLILRNRIVKLLLKYLLQSASSAVKDRKGSIAFIHLSASQARAAMLLCCSLYKLLKISARQNATDRNCDRNSCKSRRSCKRGCRVGVRRKSKKNHKNQIEGP